MAPVIKRKMDSDPADPSGRRTGLLLTDKGFNGFALDAVRFLDNIDEFGFDRDGIVKQTTQIGQQFFEMGTVILIPLDDFDDD